MGFFDKIKTGLNSFKNTVGHALGGAKTAIVNTVKPVINTVGNKLNNIGSFAGKEIDKIVTGYTKVGENVSSGVGNLLSGGGKAVEGLGQGIGGSISYLAIAAAVVGVVILTK